MYRHFRSVRKTGHRGHPRIFQSENILFHFPFGPFFRKYIVKGQFRGGFCQHFGDIVVYRPGRRLACLVLQPELAVHAADYGPFFLSLLLQRQAHHFFCFTEIDISRHGFVPGVFPDHFDGVIRLFPQQKSHDHADCQQNRAQNHPGQPSPLPVFMFLFFHALHILIPSLIHPIFIIMIVLSNYNCSLFIVNC